MSGEKLGVIPARAGSTRLTQKPLRNIYGKSLLQRVWERAKEARSLNRVVIATDCEEIRKMALGFGADVVMTSSALGTGSERVLQAARLCGEESLVSCHGHPEDHWEVVVNIQGDMPFVEPGIIDRLVKHLSSHSAEFSMATIVTPLTDEESFLSRNVVKAVVTDKGLALYFSRAPIPFPRDDEDRGTLGFAGEKSIYGYKHIGLYAFTPDGLRSYESSEQSSLERIEKLEQLRVLERGKKIGVLLVPSDELRFSVEVDTEGDLLRAEEMAKRIEG